MQNLHGITLMTLAMAGFALGDVGVKALSATLSLSLLVMLLGVAGSAFFATLCALRGEALFPPDFLSKPVLIRAGSEVAAALFMSNALALVPLSLVTSVTQAGPLVVAIGAVVIFGEKVGWRRWAAILTGLIGVLIVLRPGTSEFNTLALLAVGAMTALAARDLATRAAPKTLSNMQLATIGFGSFLVAGAILIPFTDPWSAPRWSDAGLIALMIVPTLAAYFAITAAMRVGEISVVTPFRYTRLVFGLILGVAVFGETVDAWMLFGSALVVGSGVYTVLRERRIAAQAGR